MTFDDWNPKIAHLQKVREDSIKKEWALPENKLPDESVLDVTKVAEQSGILSAHELAITEMTATALVAKYAAGELTVREVVTAISKRAIIAHQLTNCATEFIIDEALAEADRLDAHFRETGKLVGPLHGVPISAKEHFSMKGRVTHGGYVALTDNVPDHDAQILATFKRAGAVFYVRTNEPQTLMHLDTTNNITGETVNPFKRSLSAGGSTGGEGALVGLRGSILGIGSDIGGSIRCPAAFNNVFGLRPTSKRTSDRGAVLCDGSGNEAILCVYGPFAHTADDLNLFMKSYLDQEPWKQDVTLVPVPWRQVSLTKTQFTVAFMMDDGVVKPHPPIVRGLEHVRAKLVAAGVKVVDWEPYKCAELFDIVHELYTVDGTKGARTLLAKSGEPILKLSQQYLEFGKGEQKVSDLYSLVARRDQYRNKYHELMRERGVDFIISPAFGGTACRRRDATYWGYTSLWNILDQPSVVAPTGLFADPALDPVDKTHKPWNKTDEREYAKYDAEVFAGAPICFQITGRRYEDEEAVAAAKIVHEIVVA